ncbi:hypothetical protein ACWFNE_14105 [Cellulomonas sp. NPDC055163]
MTTADDPRGAGRVPRRVPLTVHGQRADQINNVDGDQVYQQYVHHVEQQRDGFLRDVAATRTKARALIVVGFVAFLVGLAAFAYSILTFMAEVGSLDLATTQLPGPGELTPFGPPVLGMPLGLLGWALAALGTILMVVGGVLHVVATARRRRVDREHPVPPPVRPPWWGGATAPGGDRPW